MALYSDKHVQTVLAADGRTVAEIDRIVADANAVYEYVHRQPGASEENLRKWGEAHEIGPDRMNAALDLLRNARRIFELREFDPTEALAARVAERAAPGIPAEHLTVAELQKVAGRLKLDVAKSATKDELVAALAAATV